MIYTVRSHSLSDNHRDTLDAENLFKKMVHAYLIYFKRPIGTCKDGKTSGGLYRNIEFLKIYPASDEKTRCF